MLAIPKFVAFGIAVLCVVLTIVDVGNVDASIWKLIGALVFPLVLIWFPDELGAFTGYIGRGGRINVETPPALVATLGWLLLLALVFLPFWSM